MPSPTHFIIRPDGTLVPVVALDELPDELLKLIGVPAKLTSDQTVGLMCAGLLPEASGEYTVKVTGASDQGNLTTNDSEPAVPLSAANEARASAVDESDRKPRRNAQGSLPFQSTLTDITERDTNSGGPSSDRYRKGTSTDRKGKGRGSDRKGKGRESDRKGKGVARTGDMKN